MKRLLHRPQTRPVSAVAITISTIKYLQPYCESSHVIGHHKTPLRQLPALFTYASPFFEDENMQCVVGISNSILCHMREHHGITFSRNWSLKLASPKQRGELNTWHSSSFTLDAEAVDSPAFPPFQQDILSAPTHVGELAQDFLDK